MHNLLLYSYWNVLKIYNCLITKSGFELALVLYSTSFLRNIIKHHQEEQIHTLVCFIASTPRPLTSAAQEGILLLHWSQALQVTNIKTSYRFFTMKIRCKYLNAELKSILYIFVNRRTNWGRTFGSVLMMCEMHIYFANKYLKPNWFRISLIILT